jgi:hypothetical protein
MSAVQELAIDDGLNPEVLRDLVGPTAVPTEVMTVFWFHGSG